MILTSFPLKISFIKLVMNNRAGTAGTAGTAGAAVPAVDLAQLCTVGTICTSNKL
jgi:hypothetical protein